MSATATVLIVDDNLHIRNLIKVVAALPGIGCLEAENGHEAVETFRTNRPDLVIMDIDMPVMNGIDAARSIRSMDPNARILIITQHDEPAFEEVSLKAGASMFLMKDDLTKVSQVVHDLLSAVSGARI